MHKFRSSDFNQWFDSDINLIEVELNLTRQPNSRTIDLEHKVADLQDTVNLLESKLAEIEEAVAEYGLLKGQELK